MPVITNCKKNPGVPPLALIVAMTRERVIGSGDHLPWHFPEELQLFKRLTMGCTVIMGRKTHISIGHPLSGRHNIVLSHSLKELPGVQVCDSFIGGLTTAARLGQPTFVIGGEELYRKALPIVSEIHISWINKKFPGNRFFPSFDLSKWRLCAEHVYTDFHYCCYRRQTQSEPSP